MKAISIIKKSILAVVLILFIFTSNLVVAQTSITTSKSNSYTINSSSSKNGIRTYHVKNGQNDFRIEYEGDITLSNDDKDIVAISRGGFIEIKKSSFGTKRRIVIHNETGTLVKKYYVGWSEKSFNSEGRKWLAEILPEILRTTTIAAKSRVDRFYKKGGANSVLSEIRKMKSDFVKAAYVKLLLEKNLSTNELVSVIETTGDYIKSDHYVSQILKSNQKAFLKNDKSVTAYINATKNIKSDHYATGILKKVIEDKSISDKQLSSLLEITKGIKSDHYLTQLLKDIMENRKMNDDNMSKILTLTKDVKSDHYKVTILKVALKNKNLSKKTHEQFLTIIKDIKSDHYISSIITEMMKNNSFNSSSINTIVKMVDENIKSDHYVSTIYKKIATKNLSENQLIMIIESSSRTMSSSHSLTSVLVALSGQVNKSSEKVKNAYRTAAKKIKSDTYYGRTMKALN
ncbi:hypothetical protein [Polaribacter uvawellassae]|uniref:hypothetical protein n=1 Tax=Polaribacter uvawellassae TaxID=3133495 RepID=UPI003219A666